MNDRVDNPCNPSPQGTEAGGLQDPGQSGIHRKALSQKTDNNSKEKDNECPKTTSGFGKVMP